jgi:hypothetical protein
LKSMLRLVGAVYDIEHVLELDGCLIVLAYNMVSSIGDDISTVPVEIARIRVECNQEGDIIHHLHMCLKPDT